VIFNITTFKLKQTSKGFRTLFFSC